MKISALLILLLTASNAVAQVIVGFDTTRGGSYNLESQTGVRNAITAALPDATFSFASALDSGPLSTAQGLVIMTPYSDLTSVSPLTTAEQSALATFVQAGGFAVILTDHNLTPDRRAANASFLNPFDVGSSGSYLESIDIIDPTGNPISNGPFGLVTSLSGGIKGSYTTMPNAFVPLGEVGSGAVAAGYFGPDTLALGSGAVLFVADANVFHDTWASPNNYDLLSNFVSFAAVPEPNTLSLLLIGSGATGLLALRRRWRKRN